MATCACRRLSAAAPLRRARRRLRLARASASSSSSGRSLYEVLGVDEACTAKELKAAYRRKARSTHPDVSDAPDAAERFKEVAVAYETLRDPEKRATYDALRRRGPSAAGAGGGARARQGGGPGYWDGFGTPPEYARWAATDDFYSVEDFLADVEKELDQLLKARRSAGTAAGGGKDATKSVWDDIADDLGFLGSQFVEFLEENAPEEKPREPWRDVYEEELRRPRKPQPEAPKRPSVDDELAELKRQMGLDK